MITRSYSYDLRTILSQQERLSALLTDVLSHFHPQINKYAWFEVSVICLIKILCILLFTGDQC